MNEASNKEYGVYMLIHEGANTETEEDCDFQSLNQGHRMTDALCYNNMWRGNEREDVS
jgi:hypothetical protein